MLNFIYNPMAGKGRARCFREAIEGRLKAANVTYRFLQTQRPRDAIRIARELTENGERDIVAMGGDGTLNEVLNGLTNPHGVNLGLIPCGSGNDFARVAGIPVTPDGALDVLLNCEPKPTDYLECSGVRGLNIIGSGIDVEILKRSYRAKWLKGSLNYFVSLLNSLVKFNFYQFNAKFNGEEAPHEALIVCACNGRQFGGGIPICPEAMLDDGRMDVVIVEDVYRYQIPSALLKLMRGRILQQKYTRHERTPRLQVSFARPTTIQIDGELYDNLPFDVRVVSDALRMYRI